MNVQQLIEELQKYPPEMRVIVDGYEGGYSDFNSLETKRIRLNVHDKESWLDRHEDASYSLEPTDHKNYTIETALLLPR